MQIPEENNLSAFSVPDSLQQAKHLVSCSEQSGPRLKTTVGTSFHKLVNPAVHPSEVGKRVLRSRTSHPAPGGEGDGTFAHDGPFIAENCPAAPIFALLEDEIFNVWRVNHPLHKAPFK